MSIIKLILDDPGILSGDVAHTDESLRVTKLSNSRVITLFDMKGRDVDQIGIICIENTRDYPS